MLKSQQAWDLLQTGMAAKEIAREVGLSVRRIYAIKAKGSRPKDAKNLSMAAEQLIKKQIATEGTTNLSEVIRQTGCSVDTAQRAQKNLIGNPGTKLFCTKRQREYILMLMGDIGVPIYKDDAIEEYLEKQSRKAASLIMGDLKALRTALMRLKSRGSRQHTAPLLKKFSIKLPPALTGVVPVRRTKEDY